MNSKIKKTLSVVLLGIFVAGSVGTAVAADDTFFTPGIEASEDGTGEKMMQGRGGRGGMRESLMEARQGNREAAFEKRQAGREENSELMELILDAGAAGETDKFIEAEDIFAALEEQRDEQEIIMTEMREAMEELRESGEDRSAMKDALQDLRDEYQDELEEIRTETESLHDSLVELFS